MTRPDLASTPAVASSLLAALAALAVVLASGVWTLEPLVADLVEHFEDANALRERDESIEEAKQMLHELEARVARGERLRARCECLVVVHRTAPEGTVLSP